VTKLETKKNAVSKLVSIIVRDDKVGQPAPHWPAPHLTHKSATRPAKLLRVRIPDPPRIRAGPRVCGPARDFFFKLNIYF